MPNQQSAWVSSFNILPNGTYDIILAPNILGFYIGLQDYQEIKRSTSNLGISMVADSSLFPRPITLNAKSLSQCNDLSPKLFPGWMNEVLESEFSPEKSTNGENKLQAKFLNDLVENPIVTADWYANCYLHPLRSVGKFQLQQILLVCMSLDKPQKSLIQKAAKSLHTQFLTFMLDCRHYADFNSEHFKQQMQAACITMLETTEYSDNYKALAIVKFLDSIASHRKGFRKDLSDFFRQKIAIYCAENPIFASFINLKTLGITAKPITPAYSAAASAPQLKLSAANDVGTDGSHVMLAEVVDAPKPPV